MLIWVNALLYVLVNVFVLGKGGKPPTGLTCDHTFFFSSDYKLCEDDTCYKNVISSFQITVGGTICLKQHDGTLIRFTVVNAYTRTTYALVYETCSIQQHITSHYRCFWAGECDYDLCRLSNKQDQMCQNCDKEPKPSSRLKRSDVVSYYTGCRITGVCRGYCGYDQASRCGWGLIEWVPDVCIPVYEKQSVSWELHLIKFDKNTIEKTVLTKNNPFLTDPYSISVNYFDIQTNLLFIKDYITESIRNTYHFIEASPRDQPIFGLLGDNQRSSVDKSFIMSNPGYHCSMDFCNFECEIQVPTAVRLGLLNVSTSFRHPVNIIKTETREIIEHQHPINGIISFTATTGSIESVVITKPDCVLDIVVAQGCKECSENPFVVFKAQSVTTVGLLTIQSSNCELIPNRLRCQSNTFQLQIEGKPKYCNFSILNNRSGQKNLSFEINYIFDNPFHKNVWMLSTDTSEGLWESAAIVFSNPNFLNGLLVSGGVLTIIILVVRLTVILYIAKCGKEIITH